VDKIVVARNNEIALEFGGLRLEVYYTNNFGDSTRVFGRVDGEWVEMLRFDDFVDTPHYHAPADNPQQIDLEVSESGEPREFFLNFLADRLTDVLPSIGFADVTQSLDLGEIRRHLPTVRQAMDSVLADGFYRVEGACLQDTDPVRPRLRDEANARFAARLKAALDERSATGA
jgi:hypothetical protein